MLGAFVRTFFPKVFHHLALLHRWKTSRVRRQREKKHMFARNTLAKLGSTQQSSYTCTLGSLTTIAI